MKIRLVCHNFNSMRLNFINKIQSPQPTPFPSLNRLKTTQFRRQYNYFLPSSSNSRSIAITAITISSKSAPFQSLSRCSHRKNGPSSSNIAKIVQNFNSDSPTNTIIHHILAFKMPPKSTQAMHSISSINHSINVILDNKFSHAVYFSHLSNRRTLSSYKSSFDCQSATKICSRMYITFSTLHRMNRDVPNELFVKHFVRIAPFDYHRVAKTSQYPFIFPSFDMV